MDDLQHSEPDVPSSVAAGLILAALLLLRRHGLSRPTVKEVLQATGAGRSRAYEIKNALLRLLPTLCRPAGRPKAPVKPPPAVAPTEALSRLALRFLAEHPGAISGGPARKRYSDTFRTFILEQCELRRDISVEDFAAAVHVPLGTLKDWLRGGRKDVDEPVRPATAANTDPATTAQVEALIAEWRRWQGSFSAFCQHVNLDLRIPFGRTLIASILEQHGERTPSRRAGRSPDEKALRKAFETFFPGAQWEGDGTPIVVEVDGQRFRFNLELMVDAKTDAFVGASVRDEEDSQAVIEAFEDGVKTTGAPALATLLDNRSSNHTDEVKDGIAPSMKMHATKGRPQNKAHVEGAFGLFAQVVPALVIAATAPREIAREVLELVVKTWARTLNHKPRKSRQGRSRVDEYTSETPTDEQVTEARAALEERLKQQEKARKTLQARQDPFIRTILDDAFSRLGLIDPEGNIRAAIARYPLDHVLNGIAIFEGRLHAGTLPPDLDGGRYLLGIVKNVSQQDEGLKITEALLRVRLDAKDRLLQPLSRTLDELLQLNTDPVVCLKTLTDRALDADRRIDRLFWLRAVVDHIQQQPASRHEALMDFVSRRIYARFAVPYTERQWAVRLIITKLTQLQ
jgi:hypothetical protein